MAASHQFRPFREYKYATRLPGMDQSHSWTTAFTWLMPDMLEHTTGAFIATKWPYLLRLRGEISPLKQ